MLYLMKSNFSKVLLLTFLILFIGSKTEVAYGGAKSMLENNPVFKLKVSYFGLRSFLLVNGVVIHREYHSGSQLTTEFPVNHWFHPEINAFGLHVYPDKEGEPIKKGGWIKVELIISDQQGSEENSVTLFDFKEGGVIAGKLNVGGVQPGNYKLSDSGLVEDTAGGIVVHEASYGDVNDYAGAVEIDKQLVIKNSLPLWKFFNAETLPDYYSMPDDEYYAAVSDLFAVYDSLQSAIERKDVDYVLELCSERSKEIDQSFYKAHGATEDALRNSLEASISDSNMSLAKATEEMLGITLDGERRLVSLTREGDTNAIGFDKKSGGSTSYPFVFRRENGKWICTR